MADKKKVVDVVPRGTTNVSGAIPKRVTVGGGMKYPRNPHSRFGKYEGVANSQTNRRTS